MEGKGKLNLCVKFLPFVCISVFIAYGLWSWGMLDNIFWKRERLTERDCVAMGKFSSCRSKTFLCCACLMGPYAPVSNIHLSSSSKLNKLTGSPSWVSELYFILHLIWFNEQLGLYWNDPRERILTIGFTVGSNLTTGDRPGSLASGHKNGWSGLAPIQSWWCLWVHLSYEVDPAVYAFFLSSLECLYAPF